MQHPAGCFAVRLSFHHKYERTSEKLRAVSETHQKPVTRSPPHRGIVGNWNSPGILVSLEQLGLSEAVVMLTTLSGKI